MERKLEKIEFVRECGDVVPVDARDIKEFEITGIKETMKYMNGETYIFTSSDDMIFILNDTANRIHKMFGLEDHRVKVFNVLSRSDISCVNLIFDDLHKRTIYAPWVDDDMCGEKNYIQEVMLNNNNTLSILIGV